MQGGLQVETAEQMQAGSDEVLKEEGVEDSEMREKSDIILNLTTFNSFVVCCVLVNFFLFM